MSRGGRQADRKWGLASGCSDRRTLVEAYRLTLADLYNLHKLKRNNNKNDLQKILKVTHADDVMVLTIVHLQQRAGRRAVVDVW